MTMILLLQLFILHAEAELQAVYGDSVAHNLQIIDSEGTSKLLIWWFYCQTTFIYIRNKTEWAITRWNIQAEKGR